MRHFIIVKFNDSGKTQELVEQIKELFNKSLNIDGVNKVEVHMSNTNLPNRHDLMIEMLLTPEGLKTFDDSEIHKIWKSEYGKYIVNKTIFDCD
jgi:ribosomal protein L4